MRTEGREGRAESYFAEAIRAHGKEEYRRGLEDACATIRTWAEANGMPRSGVALIDLIRALARSNDANHEVL